MAKTKRKFKWWWVILGIILLGALGMYLKHQNSEDEGIEVELTSIEERDINETVTASGKVFPEKEVKISSDVSGEIVELYIVEGDTVKAGQVLAKINPDTYLSAVERGKATLNNAKAQKSISEAQIESSRAQKEQIQAQLTNARNIHTRNSDLYKDGVISRVEFEQSESNLQGLQANLKAAEASLKSSEKSAEGASYNVKSTEATLKELQTSLSRTTIKAPVDGIVSSLSVEEGERVVGTIQMAGTEMMRIANLASMLVEVDVSENDILRVNTNDAVVIEVDAYPDRNFDGIVTHVSNSASNIGNGMTISTDQVTNFLVEVRIDAESYKDLLKPGRPHPFRPGMSASVDIYTDKVENVKTVPIQAVTTRVPEDQKDKAKKEFKEVLFTMEGDSAIMHYVTTGIQDDEYIQLLTNLESDLKIISGPYNAVADELEQGVIIKEKEESEDDNKQRRRRK